MHSNEGLLVYKFENFDTCGRPASVRLRVFNISRSWRSLQAVIVSRLIYHNVGAIAGYWLQLL